MGQQLFFSFHTHSLIIHTINTEMINHFFGVENFTEFPMSFHGFRFSKFIRKVCTETRRRMTMSMGKLLHQAD